LTGGALSAHGRQPLGDGGIVRELLGRPAQVGFGVLMGAPHARRGWQGGEGQKGVMHLLRRALEQATATCTEESVTAEELAATGVASRLGRQVKRDVLGGVGWNRQHLHTAPQQLQLITTADRIGLEGNAVVIGGAGDHPGSGPALQQGRGTADVVVVMMGVQHGHQLQAAGLHPGDHRLRHRRIHNRRRPRSLTVQHKDVVVVEHRNQRHPRCRLQRLDGRRARLLGGLPHR